MYVNCPVHNKMESFLAITAQALLVICAPVSVVVLFRISAISAPVALARESALQKIPPHVLHEQLWTLVLIEISNNSRKQQDMVRHDKKQYTNNK